MVNVASIANHGWRTCLERAKSMVDVAGYPVILAVMEENGVKNEDGYPLSRELSQWSRHTGTIRCSRSRTSSPLPSAHILSIASVGGTIASINSDRPCFNQRT